MSNINNATLSEEAEAILSAANDPQVQVFMQVYRKLQRLITEGYLQKGDILPTENELARLTGTSRASVRSALILLYEDGYTRSYRGKGTFVTYDAEEKHRETAADTYRLPWQRVQDAGEMTAGSAKIRVNEFDAFLNERLQLEGTATVDFACVYHLNGAPAVLANFFYPVDLPGAQDVKTAEDAEAMLEQFFEHNVAQVRCTTTAVPSEGGPVSAFEGHEGALLLVSTVWYDTEGKPRVYSKDYYNCGVLRFKSVFRRTPN